MPLKKYHWDKWATDEDGVHSKIVGVIQGDWASDIIKAREYGTEGKKFDEQALNHASNKAPTNFKELVAEESPYGDGGAVMFNALGMHNEEPGTFKQFEKIKDLLCLDETEPLGFKFDDQLPNQQLVWHVDNYPGRPDKERINNSIHDNDKVRFLIMLEDWEPGQIAQFGNKVYIQWKAGTIFTWEWNTVPHVTWNGSWTRRPALQITGTATNGTWDLISNGIHQPSIT